MGWASGGEVFDPVARELQRSGASEEVREQVCRVLIGSLQDRGWDTEDESLGWFREDPAIVRAFKANRVAVPCWDANGPGEVCTRDLWHDGDHRDDEGNTWPNQDAKVPMPVKRAALDALRRLDEEGSINCGSMLAETAETVAWAAYKATRDERNRGG